MTTGELLDTETVTSSSGRGRGKRADVVGNALAVYSTSRMESVRGRGGSSLGLLGGPVDQQRVVQAAKTGERAIKHSAQEATGLAHQAVGARMRREHFSSEGPVDTPALPVQSAGSG